MVIILASSHSFGNTRKIVDEFLLINSEADLIDLNDYSFSYFDYEFKNASDDFHSLIAVVLEFDTVIFATPIYWYTMSAQLKTFFDRLSDFLYDGKKKIGRRFRGMNMATISCGRDDELFDGFAMPFKETAKYLGMNYIGHLHTWLENDLYVSDNMKNELKEFLKIIP